MRRNIIRGLFILIAFAGTVPAANGRENWSLQQCVKYAIEHNISIRQDSLNARLAKYTLYQSQMNVYPQISASGGYGRNFGRSVNPTTNQFVDQSYNYVSASAVANEVIFSGLQVKNTILKNKYSLYASLADLDQLKSDVSLNVANQFLAVLLAYEQIHISENQVSLSKVQLDQTKAFADAGRLPELNVAQLESQLATDSSTLINAIANYNATVLDLKSLLNLDMAEKFDVQIPDVEPTGELIVANLDPEDIFKTARDHFGSVKSSELKVKSATAGLDAARGGLYPQISLAGQMGTNWANNYQSYTYKYDTAAIGVVQNSTHDAVLGIEPVAQYSTMPLGRQFSNNFRQLLSLNVNIPIFNNWQTRYSIKQSQINLETQRLNQYNTDLTLKQNVYKAHNNAMNSIEKYKAAKKADAAAIRALDFAKKRYDLGLTSTVDFLVTQNQAFVAASNLIIAKYNLVFNLKVIDYYLGKEIKL